MADNRKAYGLAKAKGIDTIGMSPKEVWEALKEKGITAQNIEENYSSDGAGGIHYPSQKVVSPELKGNKITFLLTAFKTHSKK